MVRRGSGDQKKLSQLWLYFIDTQTGLIKGEGDSGEKVSTEEPDTLNYRRIGETTSMKNDFIDQGFILVSTTVHG